MLLLSPADFFQNYLFQKVPSGALSKSLDLDQDRQNFGPDLGPICLQDSQQMTNVTASKYRVKAIGNKKG